MLRAKDVRDASEGEVEDAEDEGAPEVEEEDHGLGREEGWVRGGLSGLLNGVRTLVFSAVMKERPVFSAGAKYLSSLVDLRSLRAFFFSSCESNVSGTKTKMSTTHTAAQMSRT